MFTCTLGYNLKVFCSTNWITWICFLYPTDFCLNCIKKCFDFLSPSMLFFSGFLPSNNYRSTGLHLWSLDPPNLKHCVCGGGIHRLGDAILEGSKYLYSKFQFSQFRYLSQSLCQFQDRSDKYIGHGAVGCRKVRCDRYSPSTNYFQNSLYVTI